MFQVLDIRGAGPFRGNIRGMKNSVRYLLLALLAVFAPCVGAGEAPRHIRVLIVDGFSNHDWRLTTRSIRAILEPTGLFSVDVSTSPPDASAPGWEQWRPDFSAYDVVIQTCNDINGGPSWPQPVQAAFEKFVRRGGGVYVWHSGNNAFPDWPAYNDIIGIGWRKKDFGWALVVSDDGKITKFHRAKARIRTTASDSTPSSSDWANIPSTVACHAPGSRQTSRCTTTSAVLRKMSMCSPTRTNLTPDSTGLSNGRCATVAAACTHRLWGTCGAAMFSL